MMRRRDFLRGSLLSLPLVTSVATNAAFASETNEPICPPQRTDELWVVSSRGLGCVDPNDSNHGAWQVQRRETATAWRTANFDDFHTAASDGMPTVVYVHGNRNDWHWALSNGQAVYNALVRCSPPTQPFRFVIYSWPSDQIRGPVRDGRYKLQVANGETYRFGWVVSQLAPQSQLGLIGFSLGGRIVTGGLHLLAGGSLHGKTLPDQDRPATRAVLWAPALHNDALIPGCSHGHAMNALDRISVMYNSCDPVMKHYKLGFPGSHPIALGYSGFTSLAHLGDAAARAEQREVCQWVGKTHELVRYCATESIMQDARRNVFWQ